MNKKLLFTAIIVTVIANCAIVGCNRQTPSENTANSDTTKPPEAKATPPATANTIADTSKPATPEEAKPKVSSAKPGKSPYEKSDIEIKTFKVDPPNSGYGYDISIDKKPYVHQYNIPSVSGNNGFSTEEYAHKAAGLVVYKIRHNIMPPMVDPKELDSLGVLK